MLEDIKGPHNTCMGSDDEAFDAEKENTDKIVKFEEQQEKDFNIKQEFIQKKEDKEKRAQDE